MAINKKITDHWNKSEVVLLGGSAGAFKIILRIVRDFSPYLDKTVIIVIHRKRNFYSGLVKLFAENSKLTLWEVCDKDPIKKNYIYIAPANYHTLIEKGGYFGLDVSDPVWFSKPSIDVTFESAADVFHEKCTAILLSGANEDGAGGLLKLRYNGALTIAQDPRDAEMGEMPKAAININAAQYILRTEEIFELLASK